MKKITVLWLAWLMAINAAAVVVGPNPVDSDTLHLWHLDVQADGLIPDMVRANALDLAFYNGAELTASAAGCGNAANLFDGAAGNNGPFAALAEDYNQTIAISELTGPDGAFTLEAIVRPDIAAGSLANHMEILSGETDNGATDRGFQFRIQNDGVTLRFQTLSGSTVAFDAPITYTAGQWYHAAVTYNGVPNTAGNLKIYWTPLDGAAAAAEVGGPFTMTANLDPEDQTKLCVGNELRSFSLADENFDGLIDEVRISSVARQPDEMMLRSAFPWTRNPVPATGALEVDSEATDSLQWSPAQAANVTKYYLYMREGEPNFIDVPPVEILDLDDPILADVPLTLDGQRIYFWRADAGIDDSGPADPNTVTGPIWSFQTFPLEPSFTTQPADRFLFSNETAVFSVALYNDSGVSYRWYKDTVALDDGPTGYGSVISGAETSELTISGARVDDEGVYFCRATNDAGTTDSDSALLQINRLVSYWPLETDTNDAAGDFDMTLMQEGTAGLPTLTAGSVDPSVGDFSLLFDNGDHAADPNGRYAQIGAGAVDYTDLTITAWVYWNGGANWQRLFDFGNDTTQYMFLTPGNGAECRFVLNSGGGEQLVAASPLPVGQWVHVAVTLGGNTGRLYVNGQPRGENTAMTINPVDFSPTLNYIGKSQFEADPEFDGRIDDLKIYNYELEVNTIAEEYFAATGIRPCIDPDFDGSAFNLDNTGSSYCRIDLADFVVLIQQWLTTGLTTGQ